LRRIGDERPAFLGDRGLEVRDVARELWVDLREAQVDLGLAAERGPVAPDVEERLVGIGKQIENRLTGSGKGAAPPPTHRTDIAKALAAQAEVVQGPKTEATPEVFEIVLGALRQMLEHASAELKKAELAYAAEQADDVKPRAERDARTAELVTLMTRL